MPATLTAILAACALLAACGADSSEIVCTQDEFCQHGDSIGVCIQPEGFCAFRDSSCEGDYRWDDSAAADLGGRCVATSAADAGVAAVNGCGGSAVLAAAPGAPCGACGTGTFACSGPEALECEGEARLSVPIASEGRVQASTIFGSAYAAPLAVDGDLSTSWFSSGPEQGGQPSVYEWTGTASECIEKISIINNADHSRSSFRELYGFGQVTVQVLDDRGEAVYSESVDLSGSPDPNVALAPMVRGASIRLLFVGHEQDNCGGFGELLVNALR